MRAVVTPEDLIKGDLFVEVGWAPFEFINYEEKPAASDGSVNCSLVFKCLDGKDEGKQVTLFFNEKALGFGKKLWAFWKFPRTAPNEKGEQGYEVSTELIQAKLGDKLKGYKKRKKDNKDNTKEYNDLGDFMPLV